ncbi:hypothetical protein [Mucilaginibacter lappiensis]|uniref:Uncharacterized protein n=1 Tax=Mucilaginibacter lappiensis TaxID=354630 RepID=A0A841JCN7_9SPHI|nr:hypothetical protein [Mucilaginibacter lappiensis]MBB6126368.1 hypothetical protein [Mucilaginibacter lappiensis]
MIKADIQSLIDTEIGILKERKVGETPTEPTENGADWLGNENGSTGQAMSM